MSRENVEIVRRLLRVREHSSRTLEQKLFVRFPRLAKTSVQRTRFCSAPAPGRRPVCPGF
jgi:hypothetical protein